MHPLTKQRISIPSDIATEVLFVSDNTCCVCRERGKTIQVHHIDEEPANNTQGNLAVLCLECHNKTQIRGGFGRQLTDAVVKRFRNEWLIRVAQRRDEADRIAVSLMVGTREQNTAPDKPPPVIQSPAPILEYLESLPALKEKLLERARPEWDSGVTAQMVLANYDYIDALQGILVTLASYYEPGTFGGKEVHHFFSDMISSRFQWHHAHLRVGGTIHNVICGGNVFSDVEKMIEEMVMSLLDFNTDFNRESWVEKWRGREG